MKEIVFPNKIPVKKSIKVEVCSFSLESCQNAEIAGANRIELCAGLYEGGTTPSAGLISLVKKEVNIDLFVMIRPRGGDFLYSIQEKKVMKADIEMAKKLGADGIVLGILKKNGEVDLAATKEMVETAWPLKITFHRAIDVSVDPFEALEAIIESGCVRILTSGQQNKAIDGLNMIEALVKKAQNRIEIMAGSGINAVNAQSFLEKGVNALHLTGKAVRASEMAFRKSKVSMSELEGISEFDLTFSDVEKIKKIVEIVKLNKAI
jgi:copper homeostasis protein